MLQPRNDRFVESRLIRYSRARTGMANGLDRNSALLGQPEQRSGDRHQRLKSEPINRSNASRPANVIRNRPSIVTLLNCHKFIRLVVASIEKFDAGRTTDGRSRGWAQ